MRAPFSFLTFALLLLVVSCHKEKPLEKAPPTLAFYVVHADPQPGGRGMDTPAFPKLGYIGAAADLAVNSLEAVIPSAVPPGPLSLDQTGAVHASASRSLPALLLKLHGDDGKKLAALTASLKGQRLLIMLDEKPLMAPKLDGQIASGSVLYPLEEREDRQKVQDELERMVR